jgi:transglutaminase-like putative cysteine protease
MLFRATHATTYSYSEPVSICHNEIHLRPRSGNRQTVIQNDFVVDPRPAHFHSRRDYFGNDASFFSIHEPHNRLVIAAVSVVDVRPQHLPAAETTVVWERVRDQVREHSNEETMEAFEFVFASPFIKPGSEFTEYAAPSFPPGRPMLEAVLDLSRRIQKEFQYAPKTTTVATPVEEVLRNRHGVCQDFAHVMICALRSLGLPARYVSGYLKSSSTVVGAEDSHAWVASYCPGIGWFDVDPTNNVVPSESHVTLGWGRDYGDVTPIKGVALGGGEQSITVTVKVIPEPVERTASWD